jgi:hypothetical protein
VFDRLKFGVGVRADFAVQIDFFVLRGDPFHERGSLRAFNTGKRIAWGQQKEEEGNPLEQQLSPLRVWSFRLRIMWLDGRRLSEGHMAMLPQLAKAPYQK